MAAKKQLTGLVGSVQHQSAEQVTQTGAHVLALTRHAERTTRGPLWDVASRIPVVSDNVDAVRRATQATDILAQKALPVGVELLSTLQLDRVSVEGGGIDLAPVQKAARSLPAVRAAFAQAQQVLSGVDRTRLLPQVGDAVSTLSDVMDAAGPALKDAQHYLPTLLDVAGAHGKRSYLLVFQNNAEPRSLGGLPAATAQIIVDDGHITLAEQTSTFSLPRGQQQLEMPAEMASLYEPDTFRQFGNFTRTPNFPTTARLFDALWYFAKGEHLDGVVTLDPVVLANVLKVTGPIRTDDGRVLDSKNVVDAVLYDVYHRYKGNSAQDAFFSDVAERVFNQLSGAKWDPMKMLDALQASVAQDRLHAWFAAPPEQKLAVEFGLDGAMAADNKKTTEVGIFVNDAAYSKLEFFMSTKVRVSCDPAAGTMTTSIDITNRVPDIPGAMTNYQQGMRNKRYGIPRTSFIDDVIFFAPPGSTITGETPDGGDSPWDQRSGEEQGRDAHSVRVFVPAGTTKTVSYTSTMPTGAHGPVSVRTTPTASGSTPVTVAPQCDAAATR